MLARSAAAARAPSTDGVLLGELVGFDNHGSPLVATSADAEPLACVCVARVTQQDVGRQAAVMFSQGESRRPLLMGLVQAAPAAAEKPLPQLDVVADDQRVELRAEREIVLSCGKASITLTRAGKVIVRGAYLLSRSSGVNRIKGGSVQIN
ncbi:MAG: DUF6484 domain-containing protein [Planctomycetota bacterium]